MGKGAARLPWEERRLFLRRFEAYVTLRCKPLGQRHENVETLPLADMVSFENRNFLFIDTIPQKHRKI